MTQADLRALIHERHIIVCCGPGGVGKTTTAAAIALRAADEGRNVIVCTIDPAHRLAQALGLDELDNEPRRIPAQTLKSRKSGGELWAMMLDTKRTFDEMVLGMTTPDRAQKIFENRFYQHVSSTLSGSQEYMAMAKLFELHEEGQWNLIVIDTPPTRSALDFLDAPRRMTDFLDSRFLRALLWPTMAAGRSTFKVMNFGARAMLKMATRITGSDLLSDVAGFFASFDGMYGQFKARAERVHELLAAKRTAFLVIAAPQVTSLREARFFVERLQAEKIQLGGVIVNRTHIAPPVAGLEDPADLAARARNHAGGSSLLAEALDVYAQWRNVADQEERAIADGLSGTDLPSLQTVPDLSGDVHTIAGLRGLGERLFGPL